MSSIGVVANIYQECNALPGWLENVTPFFDDVVLFHAGPGGKHSDDGTLDIAEKWGVRVVFGEIDVGFGVVRSQALQLPNTVWTMIMDADERFYPLVPEMSCDDQLCVSRTGHTINQGALIRDLIKRDDIDAIRATRRHWYDYSFNRPTQNWCAIPDWQMRIIRKHPDIHYQYNVPMHERILDFRTNNEPVHYRDVENTPPFYDHFHCLFKSMEPEQRAFDIRVYDALDQGRPVPTE